MFRAAVGSDTGLVRSVNEDSAYASNRLVAVADGMGGRAAGDVASAVVIEALAQVDRFRDLVTLVDMQDAVNRSNRKIYKAVAQNSRLSGMGSTLTAMAIEGHRVSVAHIGDSRAYAFRDGRLVQLTADHTYVQRLIDEGQITEAEAEEHPDRSILLKVLNGGKIARPDLSVHNVRPGDRFLLCSDGLSGVVHQEEIETLIKLAPPEMVVRQLIEAARALGGPDNITCIVAETVESDRWWGLDKSTVVMLGAVAALRPDL
jgi:PPM family protein phosphatase